MLIPYHKAIDERYKVDSFIVEYRRREERGELEELVKIRIPGESKMRITREGNGIVGREKLHKLNKDVVENMKRLPSYITDLLGI